MDGERKSGRTRLAPTPSGYLHAGNALDFLVTSHLAEDRGAGLFLRIDDLDLDRARPEYVEDIFRSLEWLGIRWDIGPSGPDEFQAKWSSRYRAADHLSLADRLREKGMLYACTCSRSEHRASSSDERYPGTCRTLNKDLDTPDSVWRLNVQAVPPVQVPVLLGPEHEVDLAESMGDPVMKQRNGQASYQLASLWDDQLYGITFIVRGMDLLPSTACQLHCAELLDIASFSAVRFVHHPLLRDPGGIKLSKSSGSSSLKAMREAGLDASELHRQADRVLEALMKEG